MIKKTLFLALAIVLIPALAAIAQRFPERTLLTVCNLLVSKHLHVVSSLVFRDRLSRCLQFRQCWQRWQKQCV